MYIARQLGHTDTTMVTRTYGRLSGDEVTYADKSLLRPETYLALRQGSSPMRPRQ
jgi:integrase